MIICEDELQKLQKLEQSSSGDTGEQQCNSFYLWDYIQCIIFPLKVVQVVLVEDRSSTPLSRLMCPPYSKGKLSVC